MSKNESQHMRCMGVISGHPIFSCFSGSTGPPGFEVSQYVCVDFRDGILLKGEECKT